MPNPPAQSYRIPAIQTCALYFRPANAWPGMLVERTRPQYPPELTSLHTFSYLISQLPAADAGAGPCAELHGAEALAAVSAVSAAWAANPAEHKLWMTANGFATAEAMGGLSAAYASQGVERTRRVYAAVRDGEVAAVGLWYASSVPLNLSFLCNRLEVLVRPDAPDRAALVRELALQAQRDAGAARAPMLTALVEPEDEAALCSAGFQATGRQYGKFTWAREGERAFTASAMAIVEWYGEMHRLDVARTRSG